MKQHYPLVRTIYLYLFALLGLVLLIIGSVKFIDMGLKAFVFTKADLPEKIQSKYYSARPFPGPLPASVPALEKYQESKEETPPELTEQEKAALKNLIKDYKKWQKEEEKIDYLASRRQREASSNLAMMLVGLPLYLYHWRIIRKETRNRKKKKEQE